MIVNLKTFLENIYVVKQKVLPFLGAVPLQTPTKLQKALKRVLICCKLKVIFKSEIDCQVVFALRIKYPKS